MLVQYCDYLPLFILFDVNSQLIYSDYYSTLQLLWITKPTMSQHCFAAAAGVCVGHTLRHTFTHSSPATGATCIFIHSWLAAVCFMKKTRSPIAGASVLCWGLSGCRAGELPSGCRCLPPVPRTRNPHGESLRCAQIITAHQLLTLSHLFTQQLG